MALEVHFEIFRRQGAKGGWDLHEVASDRDLAIRIAEELMKDAAGVKVLKETYHPDTGDYLSLKIFEDGHNKIRVQAAAEDMPHALPCSEPDDFYSGHARSIIARLLSEFLARNRWTVTELIHRADALEKLEATGTLYQHSIQKVSVAQASATSTPVHHIMKNLNDLATKAVHRVYRDERRKYFPDVAETKFGALAARLSSERDGVYILNGAIARHLKSATAWDEKLARLLALMDQRPAEGPARELLTSSIDGIAAELLHSSTALRELIGEQVNLGTALLAMVELFSGSSAPSGQPGLNALARRFKADELTEARTALANRILAELKSVRRLSHTFMSEELQLLRSVANRLAIAQGKHLGNDELIAAFTLRSKRLVTHETLGEFLTEAKEADDKLERLLIIEEHIIGVENKRQLAMFVMPVLASHAFEQHFIHGKTPALQRMQRLAELQGRVRRSSFREKERQDIADTLDKMACEVEARGKVFEQIEAKAHSHVEKALVLLRLCTGAVLTEGRLSTKARELILAHLAKPGFLTGYVTHLQRRQPGEEPTADAAMRELMATLSTAGIKPETGLRSIAA